MIRMLNPTSFASLAFSEANTPREVVLKKRNSTHTKIIKRKIATSENVQIQEVIKVQNDT